MLHPANAAPEGTQPSGVLGPSKKLPHLEVPTDLWVYYCCLTLFVSPLPPEK